MKLIIVFGLALLACERTQNLGSRTASACANATVDEATCQALLCLGTCVGCCDGATCRPGTEAQACGVAGHGCVACPTDQTCTNHFCEPIANASCDFTNCFGGCCTDTGECVSGTTNATCGWNGDPCLTCPAGQSCNASLHACR